MSYRSNRASAHGRYTANGFFSGALRFTFFVILLVALLSGGLWLLALVFGLAVGVLSILLHLAPLILMLWVLWLIVKAVLI